MFTPAKSKSTPAGSSASLADPMLQFFDYAHLPDRLQVISKPFGDLAQTMVETLPRNPERSACLRKLLESKDSAVRASIYKDA